MDRQKAQALIQKHRKRFCRDSDVVIARDAEHKYSSCAMFMSIFGLAQFVGVDHEIEHADSTMALMSITLGILNLGFSFFAYAQSLKFRNIRQEFEDKGPQNFSDIDGKPNSQPAV